MGMRRSGPGQYLMLEYLRLTEVMSNGTDDPEPEGSSKFTLRWIAVHKDVKGNERADEEAKRLHKGSQAYLRICHLSYGNVYHTAQRL